MYDNTPSNPGMPSSWASFQQGVPGDLASIAGGYADMGAQNPANAASPYLNQIPGMMNNIYNPWIQQGQNALNPYDQSGQWANTNLQKQIGQLTNNPTQLMNQWGATYQSSPGYNWQVGQAQQAANQAAAAGGMAGSQAEQQNIAGTVNQLANQDYWQYMQNAQGLYGLGFGGLQNMYDTGAGLAQDQYNIGAQSANELANNLGAAYMNQGNLAYTGAINQNQTQYGGMANIAGGVGGLLSSVF
jgi:hypothetical protein